MRIDWEAVAALAQVPVRWAPYWRGRGAELARVAAGIEHATITPPSTSDAAVARLLIEGHSTLKGPLSQTGVDRSGRLWVIADGKCNHNGHGRFGNDTVGLEWFLAAGEVPTRAQYETGARVSAALHILYGIDTELMLGHRESDPTRKTDISTVNFGTFRDDVRWYVAFLRPTTTPPEETVMANDFVTSPDPAGGSRSHIWRLTRMGTRPHVVSVNGAPLNRGWQEGSGVVWDVANTVYGPLAVAHIDFSPVIGIDIDRSSGRVFVVCEDGGCVDVADANDA